MWTLITHSTEFNHVKDNFACTFAHNFSLTLPPRTATSKVYSDLDVLRGTKSAAMQCYVCTLDNNHFPCYLPLHHVSQ